MHDKQDNDIVENNDSENTTIDRIEVMQNNIKREIFSDIKNILMEEIKVIGMEYDKNTIVIVPFHKIIKQELKKIVKKKNYPSIGRAIIGRITIKEIKDYSVKILNKKYKINAKIKPMSGLVFVRQKTLEKQKKNQGKPTTKSHNSSRVSIVVSMEDSKKITDLVMVDRVEDWKI